MKMNLLASFSHGLEALRYIKENSVDIVLTDIRMPHMDGIELMERLSLQYPYIKVVVLSGHDDFMYTKKKFNTVHSTIYLNH